MSRKNYRFRDHNLVARNRKARHDYFIEQTYEAGISLKGTEIKSVRAHRINIKDGFARIENGQPYLLNVHISPYAEGNRFNPTNPRRDRRLLLHKREIRRLARAVQRKGVTIIPLKVYIKHGFAKVLIGVGKGKRQYDKRATIKKRAQKREIARYMKHY